MVPSATDNQQAKSYMKAFLTEAQWLRDFAAAQDRKLWHIVPKFHMAEHMVEQFEHLNCSAVWTFKAEDFVGRVAKVARSLCPLGSLLVCFLRRSWRSIAYCCTCSTPER